MNTIVISAINHSEMGVVFTNLANEVGHHLVDQSNCDFRHFSLALAPGLRNLCRSWWTTPIVDVRRQPMLTRRGLSPSNGVL